MKLLLNAGDHVHMKEAFVEALKAIKQDYAVVDSMQVRCVRASACSHTHVCVRVCRGREEHTPGDVCGRQFLPF